MAIARSAVQVSTQTIEGKYATALYRASNRLNSFRQVESDITKLKSQLEQDGGKVFTMLSSPLLSNSQKHKIMTPLVSKFDQSGTVGRFVNIVAANGRLAKLPEILDSFVQLCEAQKQCSNVVVTVSKV